MQVASLIAGALAVIVGVACAIVVAGRGDLAPQGPLDWLGLLLIVGITAASLMWSQQAAFALWGIAAVAVLSSVQAASADIAPSFDPILALAAGAGILGSVFVLRRGAKSATAQ